MHELYCFSKVEHHKDKGFDEEEEKEPEVMGKNEIDSDISILSNQNSKIRSERLSKRKGKLKLLKTLKRNKTLFYDSNSREVSFNKNRLNFILSVRYV